MRTEEIVKAAKSVCGEAPLHDPFIEQADVDRVARCAEREPVGYSYIHELETLVAKRCNRKHAIGVSSGTAAIHLGLLAMRVAEGDAVYIPAMTFAGVAAAIAYCGALPVPYDGTAMPEGEKVGAVIGGDLMGWPRLPRNAWRKPNFLEDCAGSLGTAFHNGPAGSFGDIATFSFNNNKIVTTNGGGMVMTDDDDMARTVRHLATTAKRPSLFHYDHDVVGFNYRMSNLCAALGVGQMNRLDAIIERKAALAERYREVFGPMMYLHNIPEGTKPNFWLNAIVVPADQRDAVLRGLDDHGVKARALYTPINRQAPYTRSPPEVCPIAERLHATVICLPSGRTACDHF